MFAWLAMTTGARHGELCALRWDRVDFKSNAPSNTSLATGRASSRSSRPKHLIDIDVFLACLAAFLSLPLALSGSPLLLCHSQAPALFTPQSDVAANLAPNAAAHGA